LLLQVRIEKDTVISSLTKQVDSLRRRQEQTTNEQLSYLEEENKKLVKERTLLQTQVSKLEHEKKLQQERLTELKSALDKMDEMGADREKLKVEVEQLRRANEDLAASSESLEKVLLRKEELESAYEKTSRKLEKLKSDWESVSAENAQLKHDATRSEFFFFCFRHVSRKTFHSLKNCRTLSWRESVSRPMSFSPPSSQTRLLRVFHYSSSSIPSSK
jgi:chromosome segregation ATPase